MTTLTSMHKNVEFVSKMHSNRTLFKKQNSIFSPLVSDDERILFEASHKDHTSVWFYFLKLFFFSIVALSTIWALGQSPLPTITKTTFVPTISKNATSVEYAANSATIGVEQLNDLKPGDRVRVFNDAKDFFDATVVCVSGNYFTIEGLSQELFGTSIFVYGKEVDNFRTIDYDAVGMMNYSNLKKLSKLEEAQQQQITSLQNEVLDLKLTMKEMLLLMQEQNMQMGAIQATLTSQVAFNNNAEADARGTRFIPNVYRKASAVTYADKSATITIENLADIRPGDVIKIYNLNNQSIEITVAAVNGNCITIEQVPQEMFGENVFVYGKEVSDLRSVGL